MHGNPHFESGLLQCRIDHTIVVHILYITGDSRVMDVQIIGVFAHPD